MQNLRDPLALSAPDFRALAEAAIDFLAGYFENVASRPVVVPTTSRALREKMDEPLPATGTDFEVLLDTVRDVIASSAGTAPIRGCSGM